MMTLKYADLVVGGKYNFTGQAERLVYMGPKTYRGDSRTWIQFAKIDTPDVCWSEIRPSEVYMLEETKEPV